MKAQKGTTKENDCSGIILEPIKPIGLIESLIKAARLSGHEIVKFNYDDSEDNYQKTITIVCEELPKEKGMGEK